MAVRRPRPHAQRHARGAARMTAPADAELEAAIERVLRRPGVLQRLARDPLLQDRIDNLESRQANLVRRQNNASFANTGGEAAVPTDLTGLEATLASIKTALDALDAIAENAENAGSIAASRIRRSREIDTFSGSWAERISATDETSPIYILGVVGIDNTAVEIGVGPTGSESRVAQVRASTVGSVMWAVPLRVEALTRVAMREVFGILDGSTDLIYARESELLRLTP